MGSNDLNAPFLSIPGVLNFRDIGGYPIASQPGKEVRRGVVYRSAEPSQITNAGREKIQQLGITVAYDLRSEREVSRSHRDVPLDEFMGVQRILAPVFRDGDYSPEAVALRFKTYRASPEVSFQIEWQYHCQKRVTGCSQPRLLSTSYTSSGIC